MALVFSYNISSMEGFVKFLPYHAVDGDLEYP
jgi:hypothetical protein